MRFFAVAGLFVLISPCAYAQLGSSFLTSDGINRAPAAVLDCAGAGNTAAPCGTIGQPLVATAEPATGLPISRSVALPAAASTTLFPVNAGRHYLALQAPASTLVWVNFVGGPAVPNGTDCVQLSAGTLYESGQFVTRGSVAVYAPVAVTISAWEG